MRTYKRVQLNEAICSRDMQKPFRKTHGYLGTERFSLRLRCVTRYCELFAVFLKFQGIGIDDAIIHIYEKLKAIIVNFRLE